MKFKAIVEYEYPIEHKPPVKAEIVLHGDKVITDNIKIIEQQPCEDYISREEAINKINTLIAEYIPLMPTGWTLPLNIARTINELPPVTPQPKTGHWIEKDGFDGDTYYDCSECGESWTTIDGTPWDNGMKFCPNCGARMEVSENDNR